MKKSLGKLIAEMRKQKGMTQLELAEQDAEYRQSLQAQMNAARDTASRDPYNQAAQAYNEMAQQFPASLAAGLLQTAELPVFAQ